MKRSGRRWSPLVAPLVSIVILLYLTADMWAPVAAPFLPEQRVERPTDGYAISLPPDWEYAVAAEVDPAEWWAADKAGDIEEVHEHFLADGGRLVSRPRSPPVPLEWCELYDFTSYAAMAPAWATLEGAEASFVDWETDPENLDVEIAYLDLSSGRTLVVDSRWRYPQDQRDYVHTDGKTWFRLRCGMEESAPDDRWRSIAQTFEFLREEG